jgi:hypothetical protein
VARDATRSDRVRAIPGLARPRDPVSSCADGGRSRRPHPRDRARRGRRRSASLGTTAASVASHPRAGLRARELGSPDGSAAEGACRIEAPRAPRQELGPSAARGGGRARSRGDAPQLARDPEAQADHGRTFGRDPSARRAPGAVALRASRRRSRRRRADDPAPERATPTSVYRASSRSTPSREVRVTTQLHRDRRSALSEEVGRSRASGSASLGVPFSHTGYPPGVTRILSSSGHGRHHVVERVRHCAEPRSILKAHVRAAHSRHTTGCSSCSRHTFRR